MKPEEIDEIIAKVEARKRNLAALGDINAPGTISNEGVVPGDRSSTIVYSTVPGDVTHVSVPEPRTMEEGFVLSITIGATLNLGNYSNAKIEVQATDGKTARRYFAEEVEETVKLVQSTLKKVQK
jgi:hypothetical protein